MYRERPPMCPHCGIELVRPSERPWWRCAKCEGTLVTVAAAVRALVSVDAQDPEIGELETEPRESVTEIACPICASTLEPVLLHGTELERCRRDEVLWFDDWEYIAMLAIAKDEASTSLPRRLARWLCS